MHRLLNTLLIMVCLLVMLACGGDTDDRMVRQYAGCLTDTNTALYRMTVSGASGPRNAERRGGGSCGKNAGERRWGGGQSGIRMVPTRLNARCVMVATECVATGADWMAGATTWGG